MEHEVNFGKSKMSKKKRIIIFIIICLIGIVIASYLGIKSYIQRYNEHVSMAEYYYENGKYDLAFKEADQIFPVGENKDFIEKISIMRHSTITLSTIPLYKTGVGNWTSLFEAITFGISSVDSYKNQAKRLGIEARLLNVRKLYTDELKLMFAMNEEDVKNMPEYSKEEKEEWLSAKGASAREYSPNAITLEITDKTYKVDGNNVYVSGVINNKSNMDCYYLEVTATYFDENGRVIDEDTKIVSGKDSLPQGRIKYFEIASTKNSATKTFSLYVSDFSTHP